MAGKGKEIAPPAMWEKEIKYIFCDLCIKEIDLGNRPSTFFNKEGWLNLTKNFKEATGRDYDRLQMKNKWDQLKKEWKLWKELKHDYTGLGWDPVKRTIAAPDEWWAERLKAVPTAKKYRVNGIEPEFEEKLDRMFETVVATGRHLSAPTDIDFGETHGNPGISLSDDGPAFPSQVQTEGRSQVPTDVRSTNRSKRARLQSTRKSGAASFRNQLSYLVENSNDAPHRVQKTSIMEAVSILQEDEDIAEDDDLFYFAVELLQDSTQRDFFTSIEKSRRVKYLRHFYYTKHM